jgi:hypothetical protein
MGLRRSTTARKVNPLSLIFIYFNIPGLTPDLHWAETALEFSDNKPLFLICRVQTSVVGLEGEVNTRCLGTSFIYMLYKVGDRTEPWGTSALISLDVDISPCTETLNLRCERKELMNFIKLVENSNLDNLYSKQECHVVKLTHAVQPRHGRSLMMRLSQSSLHIYVPWREGVPVYYNAPRNWAPCWCGGFIQHLPDELPRAPPEAPTSRGCRFLRGI